MPRAVQKRLDETVGPFNWKNVYSLWHDNSQICGISIFYDERKEWVTKFDGAENSDFEPVKGGLRIPSNVPQASGASGVICMKWKGYGWRLKPAGNPFDQTE